MVNLNDKEKWRIVEEIVVNIVPKKAGRWLNLIYSDELKITEDFIYPNAKNKMRPGNGKAGVKMPGGPQYIVIHDTGMPGKDHNAHGLSEYIHNQANSKDGRVASWHFSVDDTYIYQHVPTDEIAWHAGDGRRLYLEKEYNEISGKYDIGGGNRNGIGIETCINPDNDYELTLKRVAKLVAILLHKYNLNIDRIKQHYDFNSKNCPNIIRSTYGLWESFLKDCKLQYNLYRLGDVKFKWEIDKPNIIRQSGKVITPINDETVTIKLTVTIDNKEKEYLFETIVEGLSSKEKITKSFYELYLNIIPKTVTESINLPIRLDQYDTLLKWKSNKPNIIDDYGKYKKPEKPTIVTLKVNIKNKDLSVNKQISVKVK